MVRDILNTKNPDLRKISKPVVQIDKKIKSLINDLKETLKVQEDPEGVGLAAPQIGKNLQVFVIKPNDLIKTIINPEVISVDKKTNKPITTEVSKSNKKIMEGCLSLPNYYGPIKRNKK